MNKISALILVLAASTPASAQQYVQNGQILYEKVSVPYTYYWCGRPYTGYRWEYKQVLNYADKDWRQKALDIVDKAKDRQSFEETLNYLGAKGLLSPANSGYTPGGFASYPSATGNVLGGFTQLDYSRYGATTPLDANKAFERVQQSIDQFERSTAENARRGTDLHSGVGTLIAQNSEGARAIVEVQETRALVKETFNGLKQQSEAMAQMFVAMKPQSSETFRYQSGQQQPQAFTAPAPPQPAEDLTGEERAVVNQFCATCHGGDSPKGSFRFDGLAKLSEDMAGSAAMRIDAKAPKLRSNGKPYAMPPADSEQPNDQQRALLLSAARKLSSQP